jgi:7-cyano-7-deazaguanine synthase
MTRAVAIVSGGMDSVVLAHMLKAEGYDMSLVSFDYGQRHSKELNFAEDCAKDIDASWHLVDLSNMSDLLENSALTNSAMEVPDGHYAEQTMRITVVPNRNAIMLNIAAGLAITMGAKHVATGVHGGDHYIYPDCRPAFIKAIDAMLCVATDGFAVPGFGVLAPFLNWTKADIAAEGARLGVDFTKTWSCYKGGAVHCGACGTCFERREAFRDAEVTDPTEYLATPEYVDPR